MVREIAWDEVHQAQQSFRLILDSMSRPGKINCLGAVDLRAPSNLNASSVIVAFTLLDGDTTFATVGMTDGEACYLTANTGAHRTSIAQANFLFADGAIPPELLDDADCGSLMYPDAGTTLVLQIRRASENPLPESLLLRITGPGVDGSTELFTQGLSVELLLAIQARNAEFPLGLDTILTFQDETGLSCITALPRTTKVVWDVIH